MNKISLIFILMAAFNIGCYDEYDTVYPSVDLPEKGARAFVESIGDPNFFDIGNPNGLVSLNINTLGESVTAINIFKSYNGGTPILHESIANSGIYDISLTEAIDGLGIALSDVEVGDNFSFTFSTVSNGQTFLSGGSTKVPVSCTADAIIWNGNDGHYLDGSRVDYDSEIQTDVCTGLYIGLNKAWMQGFWGEVIQDEPGIEILIESNTITIGNQYIFTTLYNGSLYEYTISGTGTLDDSGTYPVMTINYTLDQEGFDPSGWCFDNGYMDKPYFTAHVSTDPDFFTLHSPTTKVLDKNIKLSIR